jgi:hypothetical protein
VRKENRKPIAVGRVDGAEKKLRGFAAECLELAQSTTLRRHRAVFLKMTSMWEQLAQSWEKKQLVREDIVRRNKLRGKRREGLPPMSRSRTGRFERRHDGQRRI